jgi:hypothetical protein
MPGKSTSMARLCLAAALVQIAGPPVMAADPPPRNMAPPTRIPDPLPPAMPAGEPVATSTMPEAVRRAVADDAARRFKVSPNEVVLTRAEQVTWQDGSLGCPQPGRSYTQMLVPGFRVVAKTIGGELLYHTDGRASAVNCATPYTIGPRSLKKRGEPVESVASPEPPPNPNL